MRIVKVKDLEKRFGVPERTLYYWLSSKDWRRKLYNNLEGIYIKEKAEELKEDSTVMEAGTVLYMFANAIAEHVATHGTFFDSVTYKAFLKQLCEASERIIERASEQDKQEQGDK